MDTERLWGLKRIIGRESQDEPLSADIIHRVIAAILADPPDEPAEGPVHGPSYQEGFDAGYAYAKTPDPSPFSSDGNLADKPNRMTRDSVRENLNGATRYDSGSSAVNRIMAEIDKRPIRNDCPVMYTGPYGREVCLKKEIDQNVDTGVVPCVTLPEAREMVEHIIRRYTTTDEQALCAMIDIDRVFAAHCEEPQDE